jgi:hypothetical protein
VRVLSIFVITLWPTSLMASSRGSLVWLISPISKPAAPHVPPTGETTAVYPVVTSFWVSVSPVLPSFTLRKYEIAGMIAVLVRAGWRFYLRILPAVSLAVDFSPSD